MGCNTSKEAVASVGEQAAAAAAAAGGAAKEAAKKVAEEVGRAAEGAAAKAGAAVKGVTGQAAGAAEQAAEEAEEYIDPNDPEANQAATKIQAVFRGHQTRRSLKEEEGGEGGGGGGMAAGEAEREPTQQELEAEFDPSDKELCHAATKIQASFRGHMARKQAPKGKPEEDLSRELQKLDAKAEEEELDIDLSDPDLHKAATKIQASFRGHKVRKETEAKDAEGSPDGAASQ